MPNSPTAALPTRAKTLRLTHPSIHAFIIHPSSHLCTLSNFNETSDFCGGRITSNTRCYAVFCLCRVAVIDKEITGSVATCDFWMYNNIVFLFFLPNLNYFNSFSFLPTVTLSIKALATAIRLFHRVFEIKLFQTNSVESTKPERSVKEWKEKQHKNTFNEFPK